MEHGYGHTLCEMTLLDGELRRIFELTVFIMKFHHPNGKVKSKRDQSVREQQRRNNNVLRESIFTISLAHAGYVELLVCGQEHNTVFILNGTFELLNVVVHRH